MSSSSVTADLMLCLIVMYRVRSRRKEENSREQRGSCCCCCCCCGRKKKKLSTKTCLGKSATNHEPKIQTQNRKIRLGNQEIVLLIVTPWLCIAEHEHAMSTDNELGDRKNINRFALPQGMPIPSIRSCALRCAIQIFRLSYRL